MVTLSSRQSQKERLEWWIELQHEQRRHTLHLLRNFLFLPNTPTLPLNNTPPHNTSISFYTTPKNWDHSKTCTLSQRVSGRKRKRCAFATMLLMMVMVMLSLFLLRRSMLASICCFCWFFWQCFELQYANDETLMMLFLLLSPLCWCCFYTYKRVCDVVSRACMLTLAFVCFFIIIKLQWSLFFLNMSHFLMTCIIISWSRRVRCRCPWLDCSCPDRTGQCPKWAISPPCPSRRWWQSWTRSWFWSCSHPPWRCNGSWTVL